jgi:hypothetical protein
MSLRLKRYLEAVKDPDAFCSCEDQAAILQTFLWCIGIANVFFCSFMPFGYVKKTLLIGRGITNNPFYGNRLAPPVVEPLNRTRSKFELHCCCSVLLDNGDIRILDSTIGPHVGDESQKVYLQNTTERGSYPIFRRSFRMENRSPAVEHIDWIESIHEEPFTKEAGKFKKQVGFKKTAQPGQPKKEGHNQYVVASLPDIELFSPLTQKGWNSSPWELLPGNRECLKMIDFRKGDGADSQRIQVELYVTNGMDAAQLALNRFLTLGTVYIERNVPVKKCPAALGDYAALSENGIYRRYFWVQCNVVYDVTFFNVDKQDEDEIIKIFSTYKPKFSTKYEQDAVLSGIAVERDAESLECGGTPVTVKKGEHLTIKLPDSEGLVATDFEYVVNNGLRLVRQRGNTFVFNALEASENKIIFAGVDEDKLVKNIELEINVVEG